MEIIQKEIVLAARQRGFHLITNEIYKNLPELKDFKVGIAYLLIKHTSASLTLNENADPDVRQDLEMMLNEIAPENHPKFYHTFEGSDDMPAHIKSSLMGNSLTLPICDGKFNLGTWQGITLGEHRNHGGNRKLVITIMGKKS